MLPERSPGDHPCTVAILCRSCAAGSSSSRRAPFGAYVLRGRALTAPVVALCEQHWATGAHYTAVDAGRDVSTERVRQVVALLARGMKDEAVARRLGVSSRTMRRLVAATMDELGAQSRFQSGIEAVRRGFVE